jgi:Ni/Fe-hydrogenase subunit HybB-like protein
MREEFIKRALGPKSFIQWMCKMLLLGQTQMNEETHKVDHKVARFLAALGIPMACCLHGYVGFLFGSLKANPWWDTPLMFIIFLFSAIVSGISVLIFHYTIVCVINKWKVDQQCIHTMGQYLWGFMIVAISLELMELLSIAYKQMKDWEIVRLLITERLFVSYVVLQFFVFSLIPFFLLAINALFKLRPKVGHVLVFTASCMLLVQVLLMRWNVVIGGQIISKSLRGFTSYMPGMWEKEGIVLAAVVFTLPFGILYFFNRVVPLFYHDDKADHHALHPHPPVYPES